MENGVDRGIKLYRKYIVCKDNLNVVFPMKGATNTNISVRESNFMRMD